MSCLGHLEKDLSIELTEVLSRKNVASTKNHF